jgi:Rod binding domain-containing protein
MNTETVPTSLARLHDGAGPGNRHQQLVRQTQKWVAQTFYGTMLKEMRKSPFKSKIFDGGRGGEVFQEMLDQKLADHMSRNAAPKLVDSIVQKIERGKANASYLKHSNPTITPPTTPNLQLDGRANGSTIG